MVVVSPVYSSVALPLAGEEDPGYPPATNPAVAVPARPPVYLAVAIFTPVTKTLPFHCSEAVIDEPSLAVSPPANIPRLVVPNKYGAFLAVLILGLAVQEVPP